VTVPGSGHSDEILKSLLALSDVACTGHHAAVSAGVKPSDTVAVVGDGAVGLCAVIAAKRLGAERIISLSNNPARQALARELGATDIVAERGDDGIAMDGRQPDQPESGPQATRPQPWVLTQSSGPGAPVFVRCNLRLRDRESNRAGQVKSLHGHLAASSGWCKTSAASARSSKPRAAHGRE
jgi:threonine dehydrogenase-like Zn-dependent dehydrogenase